MLLCTPIGRDSLGSYNGHSADNRPLRIRWRRVLGTKRAVLGSQPLPRAPEEAASSSGKPARLPLGDPERPAPRARPASAAPPPRPRLTPSSGRARAPQHCCSHRPTARSACRHAYVKVPGALLPERPPRARARGSPRSPAPSPHPLQRRARPLAAALPDPGHSCTCTRAACTPAASSARARLPTSHRPQQPAPPCAPLTSATHSAAPSSHPWAPSRYTRAEPWRATHFRASRTQMPATRP